MTILIETAGGVITQVTSSEPHTEVIIVDYDEQTPPFKLTADWNNELIDQYYENH